MAKQKRSIERTEPVQVVEAEQHDESIRSIEKSLSDDESQQRRGALSTAVINHDGSETLPRVLRAAPLRIGDTSIECAVLDDGTRLLTQRGMFVALGRHKNPTLGQVKTGYVPAFLAAKNLEPFIPEELQRSWAPVPFLSQGGYKGNIAFGYRAEILPMVCNVYLDAERANALRKNQANIATQARLLIRGFSTVGIIALIDEATGYQDLRDRSELAKILEKYISPERLPWALHFPHEFYEQMFRLWGWTYDRMSLKRPKLAGKLTARLIYQQLPPGVLDELRRRNPANEAGNRRFKHHQLLSGDIGDPHLKQQVSIVTTLMKISPNKRIFERNFARAFPPPTPPVIQPPLLSVAEDEDEDEW